ncbi:MOSC domain-containing protein [Muricauda sp. JGD-17]|uniref:MOSC domain-containing protein n=1 Tax=Flagellimonas ochracea TaxID=2696472 RepID=A0A964TE47_9FLAO|nr:MOSC domain-containing protein [Allomuricauda ochracea]NAY93270.1 MOSC domain-containing protein [Allomuricauda ochracea]
MKIIATNLAKPTKIIWNGEEQNTGIYKYPVDTALRLEKESVANDIIADRRVHGGVYKACYLFSSVHYPYWKEKYPDLDWDWGMFGENLTVDGLDETKICIGAVYKIGTAKVQITQPREPCYKLGIRFGDQKILKEFIDHGFPGTYVKILEEGEVSVGDTIELIQESENPLTIHQFYQLLYAKTKDPKLIALAIENEALPLRKREKLKKYQ